MDGLLSVLDADRAAGVIEHRQRIRKPLTAHAAKLLAGKFERCADPNAAADAMIANGWQGFEPEWLENRKGSAVGAQSPPPKRKTIGEMFRDDWKSYEQSTFDSDERLENSDGSRDSAGIGESVVTSIASYR